MDSLVLQSRFKPLWWQWPTVLSLDAPIVAVVWQLMVSSVCHVTLHYPRHIILGLSIWLAYVADRWIEANRLELSQIQTKRLMFYRRNRYLVPSAWIPLFLFDLYLGFNGLSNHEVTIGLYLFVAVALYLFSHQWLHRNIPWRLPKEICVALLFATGVGFFIGLDPRCDFKALSLCLFLFSILCFINCSLISIWENKVDKTQGQSSLARQFKWYHHIGSHLPVWYAGSLVLICIANQGLMREFVMSVFLSSLALKAIDHYEPRYGRAWARVMADAVLLTPLIFIIYWRYKNS
jgi:hypothetical protein